MFYINDITKSGNSSKGYIIKVMTNLPFWIKIITVHSFWSVIFHVYYLPSLEYLPPVHKNKNGRFLYIYTYLDVFILICKSEIVVSPHKFASLLLIVEYYFNKRTFHKFFFSYSILISSLGLPQFELHLEK